MKFTRGHSALDNAPKAALPPTSQLQAHALHIEEAGSRETFLISITIILGYLHDDFQHYQ